MRRGKYTLCMLAIAGLAMAAFFLIQNRHQVDTILSYSYVKATVVSAELGGYGDENGYHRGQYLKFRLTSGPDSGKLVESFNPVSENPQAFDTILSPKDRVILSADMENGETKYYFSDFDRTLYFYILLIILIISLIYFGRQIGFKSLLGIGISLVALWRGFIAYTLQPAFNVYVLAAFFCAVISFLVLLVVSGRSVKTLAALLGTWGGLAIASLLSYLSIHLMHLTGIYTEEAYVLKADLAFLDFHGILFASMMIGSLGAIIDVTISIASAQLEIYHSSPELSWRELYKRGMNVGKDIMGAMSMTLILAYVGSSLPLLLVIAADKQIPFERVLNLPLVITELTRAVIGSIGLVYAIPLTAIIMPAILYRRQLKK